MNKRLFLYTFIVTASAALFLPPVFPLERVISTGTDSYKTHRPVFGKQTINQAVIPYGHVSEIGLILGKLSRDNTAALHINIESTNGQIITSAIIPPKNIIDDTFVWFSVPSTSEPFILTGSAPEATRASAVGVRFEANNPAQLALALKEKVPLWRYLFYQFTYRPHGSYVLTALPVSITLTLILLLPGMPLPARWRRYILATSILFTAVISLWLHSALQQRLYGISGGDAYNYLSITQALTNFDNPFTVDKRLPGWPLLLAPAFLTDIDDIWWMRFLNGLSAAGILILLPLLARRLNLPWTVSLLAPLLLFYQRDFLLTSLRPEPYTFYALLVTAALFLFTFITSPWAQLSLGLILGYASMTRQEGFLLSLILGLCSLFLWKKLWWKGYARLIGPALLLVLPFFANNAIIYGHPLYTPYFEGGRNEIVNSWPAFKEAAEATWGVFGTLWRPYWEGQQRYPLTAPLILTGSIGLLVWWVWSINLIRSKLPSWLNMLAPSLLAVTLLIPPLIIFLTRPAIIFDQIISQITAGILLLSPLVFVYAAKWQGVPILLVLATQTIIALWFHPFPKHYQQDYPLLALLVAVAIIFPAEQLVSRVHRYHRAALVPAIFSVITLFAFASLLRFDKTNTMLDESNQEAAFDHVVYEAVQTAKAYPAAHGFDRYYQPASLYFNGSSFTFDGDPDPSAEDEWITRHGIRTLTVTNLTENFIIPDQTWQLVASFRAEGKNEKMFTSTVYLIP